MAGRHVLLYDGACCFCERSARRLKSLDWGDRLELSDLRSRDLPALDSRLSLSACEGAVHLLEADGRLSAGFSALRRLTLLLPALWPAAPLLRLPGASWAGHRLYEALNRLRFALGN
jgi:predicted DCC family thiol-disulfide oxidoreductase YuxK